MLETGLTAPHAHAAALAVTAAASEPASASVKGYAQRASPRANGSTQGPARFFIVICEIRLTTILCARRTAAREQMVFLFA